jgi:copper chaperone
MQTRIDVENIGCQGCVTTIKQKLGPVSGIRLVDVDVATQSVIIESDGDVRTDVVKILESAGYPERGSKTGIASLAVKAKSFVSCALGRVDNARNG